MDNITNQVTLVQDNVVSDTVVTPVVDTVVVDATVGMAVDRKQESDFGAEEDNNVQLIGKVLGFGAGFETDKGRYTEKFHEFQLSVERISGACDIVPIVCSEKLTFDTPVETGDEVVVMGKLHSRTIEIDPETHRRKTIIFCHATDLILLKDADTEIAADETNIVELVGYICKPVCLRTTSKTGRQIADIVIAVKRPYYRKKDYIPCIAWGRNAVLAGNRTVGDEVKILGRLQSREKYKKDSALPILLHEVSITDLVVVNETEEVQNSEGDSVSEE